MQENLRHYHPNNYSLKLAFRYYGYYVASLAIGLAILFIPGIPGAVVSGALVAGQIVLFAVTAQVILFSRKPFYVFVTAGYILFYFLLFLFTHTNASTLAMLFLFLILLATPFTLYGIVNYAAEKSRLFPVDLVLPPKKTARIHDKLTHMLYPDEHPAGYVPFEKRIEDTKKGLKISLYTALIIVCILTLIFHSP